MHRAAGFDVKGITALLLAFASTIGSSVTISVQQAFPSDAFGNPVQPRLGEAFYMTAKLNVAGDPSLGYRVGFKAPYVSLETPPVNFGGQATVTWGCMNALLESFPVTIMIDGSPAATISVTPLTPASGVEYFASRQLNGMLGASATLKSGSVDGLKWLLPQPTTAGFQQVISLIRPLGSSTVNSTPFAQPVSILTKRNSAEMQFTVSSSNSRVNMNRLRAATWASYSRLPATASLWLRAETAVESRSSDVAAFVAKSLPRDYKKTITPADAALKLYLATIARLTYADGSTSKPSAVQALRTGRGDCGYFASVFVAACRNIGIPARAVVGAVEGESGWHVWAEFYVPNEGWIPVDPSYGDALCPAGDVPVYFGTVPDLNARIAYTYGFDHVASGSSLTMLQSPALVVSGRTVVQTVTAYTAITPN